MLISVNMHSCMVSKSLTYTWNQNLKQNLPKQSNQPKPRLWDGTETKLCLKPWFIECGSLL